MSGSNPFDFSEYGQGSPPGGAPGLNDPFARPAAPPPAAPAPKSPAPSGGPVTNDPFAGAGADPFASVPATNDPFARTPAPAFQLAGGGDTSLTAATPPFPLLLVALALALAAGVVALLFNQPVVAAICWLVAGPIGIGLIALYVRKDTYARSAGLYAAPGFVRPLYWLAVIGCLIAIWAPAWRIADWVGRL